MIPELTPAQFIITLIIVGITICLIIGLIGDVLVKITQARHAPIIAYESKEDQDRAAEA